MTEFSPRETAGAFLFLAAVLVIFFFDVIFLGKTIAAVYIPGVMSEGPYGDTGVHSNRGLIDPGGSTWTPRPQAVLVSRLYHQGKVPLWTPYQGTGQPLAANMNSTAFNPLRLFLYINPSPYAWDLFLLFRLFLAGVFAYLFTQTLLGWHPGSLFAAVLFMLSGSFIFSLDMHHLDVECVLPMLLFGLEKMVQRTKSIGWPVVVTLSVFLSIVGGQPQSAFLILAFACAYYLFRLLSSGEGRNSKTTGRRLGMLAVVTLGGFALASVQLIPFAEFHHVSWNIHDPRAGHIQGLVYDPFVRDIISFVSPYFMGPIDDSWLPGYNWHFLLRGYVGVAAVFFLLVAVISSIRERGRPHLPVYFFAGSLVFLLAKLYGLPPVNWIGALPVSNMVRYWKYMGPLIAFSSAILAGFGLKYSFAGDASSRTVKLAAACITLFLSAAFFYALPQLMANGTALAHLSKYSSFFALPTWMYGLAQVVIALFLTGLLLSAALLHRGLSRLGKNVFPIVVILIALCELFVYTPNPGPRKGRNERYDIFTEAPYVRYLRQHADGQRTVGMDGLLYPDFSTVYGLRDIRVLDGMTDRGYMELIGSSFPLPDPPDRFTGDEGISLSDPPTRRMLDLLCVKYVLAAPRAGDGASSPASLSLVYDKEVRIYENAAALPRAFLVSAYEVIPDRKEILRRLHEQDFDPREKTILEKQPSYPALPRATPHHMAAGSAEVVKDEPSCVEIRTEAREAGFLSLMDTWYPGWSAYVDGHKTEVYRSDYAFRSVLLPPGKHLVRFSYEPRSFTCGLGISLAACVGLILVVLSASIKKTGRTAHPPPSISADMGGTPEEERH